MATELERLLITLQVDNGQLKSGLNQSSREINKFSSNTKSQLSELKSLFGTIIAAEGVRRIVDASNSMQLLQNRLEATSGSAAKAAEAMSFLQQTAKSQSVDLLDLADGYTRLLPAVNSGVIAMDDMREILTLANDNIKAFGLSSGEAQGLFLGLSQALGSGTVTMEDLRQVTDRLPGTLNAMAESVGLPVNEFKELIATGEVTADMLKGPLLSALKANEGAAESMSGSFQSVMTDIKNGALGLAESSKLIDILTESLRGFADLITNPAFIEAVSFVGDALSSFVNKAKNGITEFSIITQNMLGIISDEVAGDALLMLQERIKGVGDEAARSAEKATSLFGDGTEDNRGAFGGLIGEGSEEDEKRAEKLEKFRESLMSETELEMQNYERRLELLREFYDNGMITMQESNELIAEEMQRHEDKLVDIVKSGNDERAKFDVMSMKDKTKTVVGELSNITSGVAQHNKTLFNLNKAAGISEAIINAYTGISRTLSTYPYPINVGMAAAHAAVAFAQVNAIKSTSFEGGGAGSAPSIAGSTAAPATSNVGTQTTGTAESSNTLDIQVSGIGASDLISGSMLDDLISGINDRVQDGAVIGSIRTV